MKKYYLLIGLGVVFGALYLADAYFKEKNRCLQEELNNLNRMSTKFKRSIGDIEKLLGLKSKVYRLKALNLFSQQEAQNIYSQMKTKLTGYANFVENRVSKNYLYAKIRVDNLNYKNFEKVLKVLIRDNIFVKPIYLNFNQNDYSGMFEVYIPFRR